MTFPWESTAWCKKSSCMFEFPAFLPHTNLGLPMHSPSAATICTSLGKEICTSQGTISKAELLVGYLYLRGKIEVEVQ